MNTERAVKILKKNAYKVQYHGNDNWSVKGYNWSEWYSYKTRELINFAKSFTSNSKSRAKKMVKKFSDKKNRAATRSAINTSQTENLNSNMPAKTEDVWSWD